MIFELFLGYKNNFLWGSVICTALAYGITEMLKYFLPDFCKTTAEAALSGGQISRVLLVIAHPDDESMFFGPTLIALSENKIPVSVLCLSTGNFEGKGAKRRLELKAACQTYQIPLAQVHVKDDPQLQDGMQVEWSERVVADYVAETLAACGADTVLTFDKFGVSGHPNHKATHQGVKLWWSEHVDEVKKTGNKCAGADMFVPSAKPAAASAPSVSKNVKVFTLVTTNPIRKFSGLLDIVPSSITGLLSDQCICFISQDSSRVKQAMRLHLSQWVWFRHLFIIFSRYSYVNTFRIMD